MQKMNKRFRGFLPVVIDIETGGLNYKQDAILEIAMVILNFKENILSIDSIYHYHVTPSKKTNISKNAINCNKIKPYHPFRLDMNEKLVLKEIYSKIINLIQNENCLKAVLVGHNAWFDLSFLLEANKRNKISNMPFHNFTVFDTATLGGVFYGQTVLSQALNSAKIKFNDKKAHSALYDAIKTAQLFCKVINKLSYN